MPLVLFFRFSLCVLFSRSSWSSPRSRSWTTLAKKPIPQWNGSSSHRKSCKVQSPLCILKLASLLQTVYLRASLCLTYLKCSIKYFWNSSQIFFFGNGRCANSLEHAARLRSIKSRCTQCGVLNCIYNSIDASEHAKETDWFSSPELQNINFFLSSVSR